MGKTMGERIAELEHELAESDASLSAALAENSNLKSGATVVRLTEQRDLLWLFARQCWAWSHTCQCGHRAVAAMEKAGLADRDDLVARIDPKLALRLEQS